MWLFKSIKLWLALLVLLGVTGLIFIWGQQRALPQAREASEFATMVSSPDPSPSESADDDRGELNPAEAVDESTEKFSTAINLAIPFAPQAPAANWEQPYQDACEEAAIIMAERYLNGNGITLGEMDVEILRLVDMQNSRFGFYRDSNIAETVRLAEAAYLDLAAQAVYDVEADSIREQISLGRPVIVLVDGRKLGNQYYTGEGPDKHALVVKGFKGNDFITNDPGTRHGEDFVYSEEILMKALVDYDGDTPGTGKKAMIVLTKRT